MDNFEQILKLRGLEFVKALLAFEEKRFGKTHFLKGSTFEEINTDFGIFPISPVYPTYFVGDIRKPKDKIIFVGINPGYDAKNTKENLFLEKNGLFEGYCELFGKFRYEKSGLLPYYANIAGFLRRHLGITGTIDWDWFQENFINLEFIPYHSTDSNGLRINDVKKYRHIHFEALLNIIRYLDPKKPIFISGFPTFKKYLEKPEFQDVVSFEEKGGFWKGKLDNKYEFIGLPFLNRPKGGKDKLVESIKRNP